MEIASSSVQAMIISILVLGCILVLCMTLFYIQKKDSAKIFLLGMLGYLVPQVMIRYPLISWMQIAVFPLMNVYIVILLLSVSAAFMETLGRYFVIRYLLKHDQSHYAGVISGLGHGVCEAIFLIGITYINNLFILYLAQAGGDSTQIQLVLSAIEQVPLAIFYITLLERCFYIIIQTGLSAIMMNGMRKKRKAIFLFVFLLHFSIDCLITYLAQHGISIQVITAISFILAIISILYIWKEKSLFPELQEEMDESLEETRQEEIIEDHKQADIQDISQVAIDNIEEEEETKTNKEK